MQFSDTSTKQGVLQDVHFLTNTDSTSYATNDVVRNVNRWVYRAVTWAFQADSAWQFDDAAFTTHPIATADLVAGQQDYTLPSTLIQLTRLEVLDNAGNYRPLKHIDERDIRGVALSEFYETDALPVYYDLVGSSVFLYPAPAAADVTTSNGLKIHFQREIDVFTSADTTQEVALPELYHRIASYGAAYDWETVNGTQAKATSFRGEIEAMKQEMYDFFANRNKGAKVQMKPRTLRNRSNWIT